MNDVKITYYNLREEALAKRMPELIGRTEEKERLKRVLGRRVNNNLMIVGPDGIGKTALVYGWVRMMSLNEREAQREFLQFDAEHIYALDESPELEERYAEAFLHIPSCTLFIDDFGREIHKDPNLVQRIYRLYKALLRRPDVQIIFALEPHEYAWVERECPALLHACETLELKEQSAFEYRRILSKSLLHLNAEFRIIIPEAALDEVVSYATRFPTLGQMPQSAIRILDESIALSAARARTHLESDVIANVIETKTGVPKARLTKDEIASVQNLEKDLNARVLGQEEAIARIAKTLQRAKLGLRNPQRPLGSFLMLGPSGVGKTETAKSVAEILFGRAESFVRFDMSEYQQDHTVQRLIGAPAGYVGFEEGGALTNALRKEPHSLILLDEIEKAHPKVFDVFLQVLDDGRLTSGQNETVDVRNAIVMATSNAAVPEILKAFSSTRKPNESFIRDIVVPILSKTFRLEFINRFDAIVLFHPLSVSGLMRIAELEIRKIEQRFSKHRVRFEIEPSAIEHRIRSLADPRFGARPIKRFIEETCETLLADSLMSARTSL
ncbi:ATP-dependent Clp protease ATP-binding subunit [Candidatus Kaiserbacteria bacterium]|nr:ATP-dependent Clp protease ATP-binding subunit [Candidatus Kaiserbacteria bacterium]